MRQSKKSFDPAHDPSKFCFYDLLELTVATRYGAKPDFGSTFANFQGGAGFQSESDRFKGTATGFMKPRLEGRKQEHTPTGPLSSQNCLNTKITFQQEDKRKAEARREARIAAKKAHVSNMENNIFNAMESADAREQQKIIGRAGLLDRANH